MTSATDESVFAAENIFGRGEPNTAFAQYFTGESFLNNLVADPGCVVGVHNVTFAPGCRNNWHIHHASSGGGAGAHLHGGLGLVSGGGPGRRLARARLGRLHSRRR